MNCRKVVVVVGLLGSFVLGSAVGAAVMLFRTVPASATSLASLDLERSGTDAYVKYRYGSYEVAKAALLEHAQRLSTPEAAANPLVGPGAEVDLGLTYGRLAIAAERADNEKDAADYMLLATQTVFIEGQQARESQVRMMVTRLDEAWDRRLAGTAKHP